MADPRPTGADRPQSLGELLAVHQQRLVSQAQVLMSVEHRLLPQLDGELRSHLRVARCDAEALVLLVANVALATKVRFMADEILGLLAPMTDVPYPEQVKVRLAQVSVALTTTAGAPKLCGAFGAPARKALNATAEALDNPRLCAVLRRIAARK